MSHFLAKSSTPGDTWSTAGNTALPVTSRPITQHGVEGMPAPQSGHVQKRVHLDKRYYTMTIQSHINKIRDEMVNLKTRTAKQKPASATLQNDRKTAKVEATGYAQFQQQLSVLNIALEMHLSRINGEHAVAETAAVNKRNASVLEELERMYMQKTTREELKAKLEKEMENENERMRMIIDKLPPDQAHEYVTYAEENRQLLETITKLQEQIKNVKDSMGQLHEKFVYNNAKQTRLKLIKQLESSRAHRLALQNHLQDVPVEKERETLLKQVKDDKADAEALQKMKSQLEQQVREKNEHLNGLEQELDSKNSARLKKYRDVHVRHAQVNSYIDMFDQMVGGIKGNMEEKQKVIGRSLDFMLEKVVEENFEEVDDLQNELSSGNLTDEFKLLSSRLARLVDIKGRFEDDLVKLKQKHDDMREEMRTFKDIEGRKRELTDQKRDSEERQKSLQSVLNVTVSAVDDAKRRLAQFENTLEKNDYYREVVLLGKQLEQLEEANEKTEEDIKNRILSEEATKLLDDISELTKKRNEALINTLKSNKTN